MVDFSTKDRVRLAKIGQAMPDGGYPIRNVADLKRAIAAYGRGTNKTAVKKWIKKRAKELDAEKLLPSNWEVRYMNQVLQADELQHYGIKGMKWGHRKKYISDVSKRLRNAELARVKGLVSTNRETREASKTEYKAAKKAYKDIYNKNLQLAEESRSIVQRILLPDSSIARYMTDFDADVKSSGQQIVKDTFANAALFGAANAILTMALSR